MVVIAIIFGFTSIFYCTYGENILEFADLISVVLVLFKWMNFSFNIYPTMPLYSALSPFVFISFMIMVSVVLLNMIVAIIMSNYEEFAES